MLLTSEVAFGEQFNLTPGITLSPEQMANLTTDIVWLVNKQVILPDGGGEMVSVPQVNVSADMVANLFNSGEITSRQLIDLNGKNIHHSGRIQAKAVQFKALKDIQNFGRQIGASNSISLFTGP
ncbi:MAG TPA: hypothetical protein ACHBX0_14575 [Arsenophonus sp.]